MYSRVIVGSLLCMLAVSCSHKINPEKPVLFNSHFRLDSLPSSEITVPVRINLKPIYAMAERQVDTLYISPGYPNEWVQEDCATRYKYTFRRGPLQMKASGNSLDLAFTGYYRIIGSTRVCVAGAPLSSWTAPCRCGFDEAERRVNVSFTNSIFLQPDYKARLTIKRNEPKALDKCEICFWGQDITSQVLSGLKEELDTAKVALERNYGLVDLRPRFQMLWNQLNKAFNIYNMGWLQINPQRVFINNLYAKDDSLYVYLGLSARPVVSFERPVERTQGLPQIGTMGRRDGFSIFVDAMLNYDSLSNIMNHHLVDRQFDFNKGPVKKKFIIRNCKLSGAGNEKLIIQIDFSGSNEGTVYLTGKPVYTRETRVLEIKDIDFDIRSRNALLKTAEWLFSRKIVNEISRNTRFDLTAYIDTAKATISRQLNTEWLPGVSSVGGIDDIQLIGIYPMERALIIRSNCAGSLAVKVDSIDFSL